MKNLAEFIDRNFNVSTPELQENQYGQLEKFLAQKIQHMINHNHEKLFQILYRIDVSEKETAKCFELGEIDAVSMALAQRIIQRQLKKQRN